MHHRMHEPPSPPPDPQFLEATLARFEKPLLQYCLGIEADLHQARDIVQETFIKLAQTLATVDRTRVAPWLFTVCRNRALDHVRKHRNVIPMETEAFEHQPTPAPNPAALMEQRETAHLIRHWIGLLPEKQREAVRLKFEAGLSYQEISEALQTSPGNVGTLIHLGVQALRQRWAQQNPSPRL